MELLKWDDEKMGLGIKKIDEQHKELLNIINQLSYSINKNSQKKDILTIIDKIIDYVEYHFNMEEKLFDQFQYEESQKHKNDHIQFSKKFAAIKNKITTDKAYLNMSAIDIAEDIFIYMINWFINHITGSDRKYASLLKKHDIE